MKLDSFCSTNISKLYPSKNIPQLKGYVTFGQSSDTVQLTEKTQFENKLNSKYKKSSIKVSLGDFEHEWTQYNNSQMGSQSAFWAKDNKTGELYYVKFARNKEKEGHIESEILANKLYQLAGIKTAKVLPIVINGEYKALASKYETGLLNQETNKDILKTAFAVDAWLANWDSLLYGNTFIQDDKVIKIDNGGALNYRAEGKLKPNFGDKVNEIITLVNGYNIASRRIYSSMTQKELINSFNKVCNIKDEDITKIVQDKKLAKTLINRKNYLKQILEKIEETPFERGPLDKYLTNISKQIPLNTAFNKNTLSDNIENLINSNIYQTNYSTNVPSSKFITKNLVNELKKIEKQGIKISKQEITDFLKEKSETGFNLKNIKSEYNKSIHKEMQKKIFARLVMLAENTPQKENEKTSSYINRLVKLREKREKQLEDFRIKLIKSKLKYENESEKYKPRKLTNEERKRALEEIEKARINDAEFDILILPKLNNETKDKQIYNAWAKGHLGSFSFRDNELQKAVMQIGGRYNSKHPMKTKSIFEIIMGKDYKQEFEHEPVYHWFDKDNPEKFIKEIPKVGEIYTLPDEQCCSTHKHYAEEGFGDHISDLNIKFIMHPKSETSRAYNTGYNQEVVYPMGEQFRILDKELVEYIDPDTNAGFYRWEVHMQEI